MHGIEAFGQKGVIFLSDLQLNKITKDRCRKQDNGPDEGYCTCVR